MKLIVTAGGQGTKLWPYSTEEKAKQFQKVLHDKSLFTYNIETLLKGYSPKDIFVNTKQRYLKYALEQAPQIPLENYLIEPDAPINSGPAWGLTTLKLLKQVGNEPYMLVQVDCIREPEDKFIEMIADAEKLIRRDKKFITGGMKALFPGLGIDYLKLHDPVKLDSNSEIFEAEFVPRNNDYYKTKEMIQNFHVVIHCNHLCYLPELMLEAYKKYRPDWHQSLMEIQSVLGTEYESQKIEEIYNKMEAGPVEEVSKHLINEGYVILLPFKWSDIGTWDSLYQYYGNKGEVYADGQVIVVGSTNSIIKSDNAKKLVAVAGLDNMIVVDTKDVLLIVPKDKSEMIKDIQKELQAKGLSAYL